VGDLLAVVGLLAFVVGLKGLISGQIKFLKIEGKPKAAILTLVGFVVMVAFVPDTPDGPPSSPSSTEELASATPAFASATPAQMDNVVYFMEDNSGLTVRNAYQARSESHERLYFVAAEFVGPGTDGEVGVWAHFGTPEDPGITMSVNGYAHTFCVCPEGQGTAARVTMDDPPAYELMRFVEKRVAETSKQ
jgi:hypothetical protein